MQAADWWVVPGSGNGGCVGPIVVHVQRGEFSHVSAGLLDPSSSAGQAPMWRKCREIKLPPRGKSRRCVMETRQHLRELADFTEKCRSRCSARVIGAAGRLEHRALGGGDDLQRDGCGSTLWYRSTCQQSCSPRPRIPSLAVAGSRMGTRRWKESVLVNSKATRIACRSRLGAILSSTASEALFGYRLEDDAAQVEQEAAGGSP